MTTDVLTDAKLIALSEVFPLTIPSSNLIAFRLAPNTASCDRELGNRLSFHLGRQFPQVVVTWYQGDFFTLIQPDQATPTAAEWRTALERVRTEVQDISDRPLAIQWIRQPQCDPIVLSQLACQVLQMNAQFSRPSVLSAERVTVNREVEFWAEAIALPETRPAIALSVRSDIGFRGTVAEFYESHALRHDPAKLLIGLQVKDLETNGQGVITEIVGTIDQKRNYLLQKATGAVSQQALREAPEDQPVVGVQFGRGKKVFEYAIAALRPRITEETADRFEVHYGQLLRSTKVQHLERTRLLKTYKQEAAQALASYGIQLQRSINSSDYPALFSQMPQSIQETPLLFGDGHIGTWKQILTGLKTGGVYYRHPVFQSRSVQIAVLKLCDVKVNRFLQGLQYCLQQFGFQSEVIERKDLLSQGESQANVRANLEKALNETAAFSPDVVLLFLPQHDRKADQETSGSLYQLAYSQLLRRQIASQFIYEETFKTVASGQILNQVVPGILAKLGNLPFVLAEPLTIADYCVGLDVSRVNKRRQPGTMNACASVRLYGNQGNFVRYRLEDGLIEGEEIPQRFLEQLFPATELESKTVLIYRDGFFCGQEVQNLLERASAIAARFILVECRKSRVPRLYTVKDQILDAPEIGQALLLSNRDAILITTKVSPNVGLARPLRLKIHPEGHQVPIEQVIDTTLKLTLLHHGALKAPRLPMPLHGADRMAGLRLNGIYPSALDGDRQFWL